MIKIIETLREYKRTCDAEDMDMIGRTYAITTTEVYTLCEFTLENQVIEGSSDYRRLRDCQLAIIYRSWDIVGITMPQSLYGIAVYLDPSK